MGLFLWVDGHVFPSEMDRACQTGKEGGPCPEDCVPWATQGRQGSVGQGPQRGEKQSTGGRLAVALIACVPSVLLLVISASASGDDNRGSLADLTRGLMYYGLHRGVKAWQGMPP